VVSEDGSPHELWDVPAEPEDYDAAATVLISAVEPEASEQRVAFLARLLKTKEYSKAEIALVMKELPFDPEASHNYGRGFNPADIQRIVDEHRTLRARLDQRLSSSQRDDLIAEFPEEVDPDGFECAGFNEYDEPLWYYAPDVDHEDAPEPRPQLGDGTPGAARQESDTDGEVAPVGQILNEAQQHAQSQESE